MNSNNMPDDSSFASSAVAATYQRQMQEKERTIADLQERVASLSGQLALALQQRQKQQYSRRGGSVDPSIGSTNNGLGDNDNSINNRGTQKRRFHPLSPHAMNVREVRTTTTISAPVAATRTDAAAGGGGGRGGGQESNKQQQQQHVTTTTTTTSTTVEAVVQRERLGRNASIATRRVLDSLAEYDEDDDNSFAQACAAFGSDAGNARGGGGGGSSSGAAAGRFPPGQQQQRYRKNKQQGGGGGDNHPRHIIQRILDMFQHPSQHLDYLNSEQFAKDLLKLASNMRQLLEREPRVLFVQSPVYVFGDIHGNLEGTKKEKEERKLLHR
jgi:hypothetical protein